MSANAAEQDSRGVCSLRTSSDTLLKLKVTSGKDSCGESKCFAAIYEGILIDSATSGSSEGNRVSFTTSSQIQIGEKYALFADKIKKGEESIVFHGAGYEVQYEVPDSVIFYVPIDGAFALRSGAVAT